MNRDLTNGSPARLILSFMVPVMLGNLFQLFYNVVDSIIVGQFVGVDAFAAVGSTGSLVFMVTGFITGLCGGFTIPVAYYFGAKDENNLKKTLANIIYLCVAVGIALTLLTVFSTEWALRIMNTPADIFDDAYAYVMVMYGGLSFTLFYNILAAVSRALGDSRTPLIFLVLSAILNIGLDLHFVVTLGMRTAGAAWATILSQAIAGICCFIYMIRKFPKLRVGMENMKIHIDTMKLLLSRGLPMALQSSIMSIGTLILQSTINPLGSTVVASITAAGKVQQIIMHPLDAVGITMATYASQNLGAKKLDRISKGTKSVMLMNIVICAVSFALVNLFGVNISRLFIAGDQPDIFAYIKEFLFINSFFYVALGVLNIYKNSLQGIGYTVPAMGAGLFELTARAGVGILFVRNLGFSAVCFANGAAWAAAALFVVPMFLRAMSRLREKPEYAEHGHTCNALYNK